MGEKTTHAQIKATNKYIAKAYDRLNLFVPKGCASLIKSAAGSAGESVNGFVTAAILARLGLAAWPDRPEPLPEPAQPDAWPTPKGNDQDTRRAGEPL